MEEGSTVAVFGLGAVGLAIVQVTSLITLYNIGVTDYYVLLGMQS